MYMVLAGLRAYTTHLKHAASIMDYWSLYVEYIRRCVRYNNENDIDPAHYQMEWNHFFPRCIFGDWPIGDYLLLKQHAIASALQTLVFKQNCMCGWHKKYLSPQLIDLAWPFFVNGKRKDELEQKNKGIGIHDPEVRQRSIETRRNLGKGIYNQEKARIGQQKIALMCMKAIVLIHPDGQEEFFDKITEAAKKYDLKNLSGVLTGKRPHCRGFTARYAS